MLSQIQIHPDPSASTKEKGDFFEALLRAIMETLRYRVTERVNFTGTEIDLMCDHSDRPDDHALVECKARASISATDIKNFAFDVLVTERAEYGFFVHTSELQHQAAGIVKELRQKEPKRLIFWGPEKVIELLHHANLIASPSDFPRNGILTPTKRILLYTYLGRFWVTILSNKVVPTHYHISSATSPESGIDTDAMTWIANIDELQGLSRIEAAKPPTITQPSVAFDAVAEIQEAEQ
jgi:Restriction endonuclease